MLTPAYTTPTALEMPDIYTAVFDYIATFALPALDEKNIYRGWQNRAALPPDTNEYAVYTIISTVRHGASVEELNIKGVADDQPEIIKVGTYYETAVQIDCCSDSDNARQRATMLANFARSSVGVNFFKKYGLSIIDSDSPSEITMFDESNQFVPRYMITLRLSYWVVGEIGMTWLNDVNFLGVRDVDAFTKK